MKHNFDEIHNSALNGWGFSFRRSQLYRFDKYLSIIQKYNIDSIAQKEVLEIGCSVGFFTNYYLKSILKSRIVAIDISKVAIDKAKQQYSGIDFRVGGIPGTKFSSEQFYLVTVIELLYYLSEHDRIDAIDEVYRLLSLDGFMLLSVNMGKKPYFSLSEIRDLVSKRFNIVYEDGLYIKSYYKYIEAPIWFILEIFSSYENVKIKNSDTMFRKILKHVLNLFIRNKFVFYTFGFLVRIILKTILYIMPINIIDILSRKISKKEQLIYIALAKKKQGSLG